MSFKPLYTNLSGPQGDINTSAGLIAEAGQIGVIVPNSSTGDPEVQLASSGTVGLFGVIDDSKTTSFSATVVNEVVASGQTILSHANIIGPSAPFVVDSASGTVTVTSKTNGTITVAGIVPGDTTTVSYSYLIPGKAGDDSTLASGKCTIWLQEGEYSTDVYEISSSTAISSYVVGASLYVANDSFGQAGRLTTRNQGGIIVGYVTKAPTAGNPFMNFFKRTVASA